MQRRPLAKIVLAAYAALALATAGAQENIDLPDFGDSAGAIISPEQERRLGENFMREMRRQAPIVYDEEVEDYIQELGHSLSDLSDYYGSFTFFVIDSPVINAFAVPGGFIFFHTGLILETQTESELASVVGHEISHVTQRHGARMIEAASQMNAPTIAAMIAGLMLAAVNPQAGMAAVMASQAAAMQAQINFTRANEKEADAMGIRLMSDAGYDTEKMAVFFERMQRASRYTDPAFIPEYLRTHPITINRIAEAKNRAESVKPAVIREDSYKYQLIRAKLRVRAESDPMQARHLFEADLAEGKNEDISRYGLALALSETGDFPEARVELAKLIGNYPTIPSFRIAAGQVERQAGDFRASLLHYKRAWELDPENRAAVYGYVNALLLVGSAEEAKQMLRDWGLADRRDPKFYKLLAEAETQIGESANAHHSLAEFYLSVGEYPHAAEQLRLARETEGLSNYQRQKIVARLEEVEKTLMEREQESRRR
ncbi:MAG: M48 family metalloprotease [Gammaproteobacteria bacterium]|jgi:predicted Zn-dependent protease